MIACRAESRAIFLLKVLAILAVAVGGFVSAPAPAQIGPPIRLLPPADNTEPPLPEPRREPPSIELADPLPIDADGVGLLDAAQGALPETLWRGSNRAMVERLIGDIPAPIVSPAVRGLALRVLASGGEPPAASAGALPDARSFVAQRAEKLLALGDVAGAASLARLVPTRGDDATLGRVLLDAAWFTGDEAEACGLAFEQIARFDDAYRQKSLIYCQAGRGEKERAQLGLRMMREQAADEDAGFAKLMALLLGESRVALDSLKQATPLHVVMTRAARQQVPADAAAGATPAVLAMIAGGTNASVDIRLGAAERAEAAGAIATAALAQAYDAVAVRPDDLARAIDIAGRERGPRARWHPAPRGWRCWRATGSWRVSATATPRRHASRWRC
jgi:hypothetical protein